ncbi:MAG TPA: hypothetical protein VNL17_05300 [Verrucomicrobiae bacterium]|nr:hypothetical protein [Verrucomicrobiae bacterium]
MTIAEMFHWRATLRRGRMKQTDATKRVPPNGIRFLSCVAGSLLLLTAGCDLHDFIHWTPDGQHAFVQGNDGTWLIDGSGTILGPATDARAWLPDSHHVIAVRAVKPKTWDEYAQLLDTNNIDRVTEAADHLVNTIKNYHDDWSKFSESVPYKKWEKIEIGDTYNGAWLLQSVTFYLRQINPQAIAPVLDAMPADEKAKIDDLTPDIHEIIIRNVLPSEPPADQLLARFPFSILWASPSTNGQVIAFTAETPGRPSLYVIPGSAAAHATLVDEGVTEADWSTDGQNLVYAKTTLPYELLSKGVQLGTITTRQVCGTNGQLLVELPPSKDFAGVLLSEHVTRVACLPDGRILFAAATVHLPAITADMPGQLTLFALPAGATQSVVSVISPADIDQLPNRADRFVLSPDKKKVAIPGNAGQVSILSLDTGKVVPLQVAAVYTNTQSSEQLIPSWRSANEIALAVPVGDSAGSSNRVEAVLANLGGGKTLISRSWPTNMADLFLPPAGK